MSLQGKDSVVRALLAAMERQRGAAAAALYQEGLAVDAESVKRTPVDTGRLRATHYVSPPVESGNALVVEIGNGTDYAVYVHEMTELRHVTGEAKFLQNALNARSAGMLERLAKRTRANVRAGVTSAVLSGQVPTAPIMDLSEQLGPTRQTFDAMRKADRRQRVSRKRAARRYLAKQRADQMRGAKKAKQVAKQRRKAQTAADRKAAKLVRKDAQRQAKKERAYAARWKAAEKAHAKKSRTGWKKSRRKFRKRRK